MEPKTYEEARFEVDSLVRQGWRVETDTGTMVLLSRGRPVNHVLHLVLGLFTFGFWWLVWPLVAMFGGQRTQTVSIPARETDKAA